MIGFHDLYERHWRDVYRFALFLSGSKEEFVIFTTSVASVYPLYLAKVERKGRTQAEVDQVIEWLTGYDEAELQALLEAETTFEDFFAGASLNPDVSLITGVVCGVLLLTESLGANQLLGAAVIFCGVYLGRRQ